MVINLYIYICVCVCKLCVDIYILIHMMLSPNQIVPVYLYCMPSLFRIKPVHNFLVVRPHIFQNSIGQERDRFIIPRLLTNRIAELCEDEPPKFEMRYFPAWRMDHFPQVIPTAVSSLDIVSERNRHRFACTHTHVHTHMHAQTGTYTHARTHTHAHT